ncbi:YlaI family protein [Salimicrobium salexigens]|uniref:Uncharacterized protein YlaI n=1 Tax=Salimicrobium salexigens TaxID=908941 RepID=A0ABY1KPF9_9BACI|nr:YlaI family protein [Salimicrobium salexigens]SIS60833.1 Uncharacterized protein YlaI [Salimicrobium salexigens]
MRVQCVICDHIESIDSKSLQAKRLRNRRNSTYMCQTCHDRIADNTAKRVNSGNFIFRREIKNEHYLS